MKLFIKNMKGSGCIKWLRSVLDDLQIQYEKDILLGELVLSLNTAPDLLKSFRQQLEKKGLAIIYDRKDILSEQIKHLVFKILESEHLPDENYSCYISSHLHLNYTYLANIFSETQGITIEHFIIERKIEKAKELLQNSDYNVGQIADILHYSSIGHLSNQFKKLTGVSPSEYKKQLLKKMIL